MQKHFGFISLLMTALFVWCFGTLEAQAGFARINEPVVDCDDQAAAPQQKVFAATLIANSAYTQPGWKLANPNNDIELVGKSLERLGFRTRYVRNARLAEMRKAISDLATILEAAPKCSIGLVLFSGMGGVDGETGVEYQAPIEFEPGQQLSEFGSFDR